MILFRLICITVLLSAFSSLEVHASEPLKVIVSIQPQEYFVKKIGGEFVDITVMVLPGASPHTYEPKPRQMADLQKAVLYFAIGVPFEDTWLKKFEAANEKMKIIHTEQGIEKIEMKGHYCEEDSHHEKDHHATTDPHIWLSPDLVMIQARNIKEALVDIDPGHKSAFETNYEAFVRELTDLDQRIRGIFSGKDGSRFMVQHPSWGYFAKAYGLEQIPVEIEGKEPKAKALQDLMINARQMNVKAVFVQPQFSAKSARTIADAVGCKVISADPLALAWSENLLKVAEEFRDALR
ncbi:Periplasmic solute binding family protein [uncultured Desulfobacterium sp.]|uniref:Periplasmic solute binding family protein n=1 Tax=uncultured Desulfobacterium sp. TaxID=201089 RepID=A0A445MWU3_9BACT|nr:Periplasmic solute binding family protein [uncultured Desulfobacterium sp.]